MPKIVAIVEGHGEVEAVPILMRRLIPHLSAGVYMDVLRPIRVKRQKIVRDGELEKAVELAARQTTTEDRILVLLDAEDDCPAELAPRLLERATRARPDRVVRVVLANHEYETWFVAAAASLAGVRRLAADLKPPDDAESIRGAKEWLTARMTGHAYRETLDQPALTAVFDMDAARAAPSFDKLCRDVAGVIDRA